MTERTKEEKEEGKVHVKRLITLCSVQKFRVVWLLMCHPVYLGIAIMKEVLYLQENMQGKISETRMLKDVGMTVMKTK